MVVILQYLETGMSSPFNPFVEISNMGRCEMADDNVSKQKNDILFGLGELMRQTDGVLQLPRLAI